MKLLKCVDLLSLRFFYSLHFLILKLCLILFFTKLMYFFPSRLLFSKIIIEFYPYHNWWMAIPFLLNSSDTGMEIAMLREIYMSSLEITMVSIVWDFTDCRMSTDVTKIRDLATNPSWSKDLKFLAPQTCETKFSKKTILSKATQIFTGFFSG